MLYQNKKGQFSKNHECGPQRFENGFISSVHLRLHFLNPLTESGYK